MIPVIHLGPNQTNCQFLHHVEWVRPDPHPHQAMASQAAQLGTKELTSPGLQRNKFIFKFCQCENITVGAL